jgi:hypothetical protein
MVLQTSMQFKIIGATGGVKVNWIEFLLNPVGAAVEAALMYPESWFVKLTPVKTC